MRGLFSFEQLRCRAHSRPYAANSQARLLLLDGMTTAIPAVQNVTVPAIRSDR